MPRNFLRIEKNLTHSYLYLHGMEWKEKSHEQKIIQQCLIPGTLPFRLIQEETETIFQYNFYPYEKIVDYFAEKPMNLKHIIALFESIHSTLLQMEEYLLSPEILGLKKEEIFFDAENNRFLFPLIPSASGNPDEEIKDLIDFIFPPTCSTKKRKQKHCKLNPSYNFCIRKKIRQATQKKNASIISKKTSLGMP